MSAAARGLSAADARGNPFSAARLRPGCIPYLFAPGDDLAALVVRLAANRGRGQIVGPHGSGKSTVLAMLAANLTARGHRIKLIELRDGQRRLPREWRAASDPSQLSMKSIPTSAVHDCGPIESQLPATLIFVDGYEQLGWLARRQLSWRCWQAGWGLVVTSHVPVGCPTLATTRVDLATAQAVVETLTADASGKPSPAEVADAFARCGGNLREMLFDLYDRYEAQRR
jgi:energy-coupling factor transporter ATP-binding protein EcfA2